MASQPVLTAARSPAPDVRLATEEFAELLPADGQHKKTGTSLRQWPCPVAQDRGHFPCVMPLSEIDHQRILKHYDTVLPYLERSFGGIPVVSANYPGGFGSPIHWRPEGAHAFPHDFTPVQVPSNGGTLPYIPLKPNSLLWLVHRYYSVEFHSWAPIPSDPTRVRFARILLEPTGTVGEDSLKEASLLLRRILGDFGLQAILLLSGVGSPALWIPLSDAPRYPDLRAWLHRLSDLATRRNPTLFTTQPNTAAGNRIHLHVSSNAPGLHSALPYSLRGREHLPMCTPIRWEELPDISDGEITAFNCPQRLATVGDVFAATVVEIGPQRFADAANDAPSVLALPPLEVEPRGRVITAAIAVLSDGKPRDADELLAESLKQHLLPATTTRKYIYSSLIEYIARTTGHKRRPAIVQNPDRRFRINHTPDDWPALDTVSHNNVTAQTAQIIERLQATAVGSDPEAFEIAVCDAFAQLGFRSCHLGGRAAPDGYADAQLGVLGYRVMLECKTGSEAVSHPNVFEAAKYRDAYHAQYCAIVGPAFGPEIELATELKNHQVSAWSVHDLTTLLNMQSNAHEMRPLFDPGYAGDILADLLWDRLHGENKRVTLTCEYILKAGWAAQVTAAANATPADSPRLTTDAAMLVVDQALARDGSKASCAREEVEAAFAYLTNPRVAQAVWTDAEKTAIVVTNHVPLSAPT